MISVTAAVQDAIIAHARADAPVEACGYLAGPDGTASVAIPLKNVDASPEHFTLDPAEQFAAVRQLRAEGLRLRAVYHSHPASPSRPSAEDIRLGNDPSLSYIIVSLAGVAPVVKSFRYKDGRAEEEELRVELRSA